MTDLNTIAELVVSPKAHAERTELDEAFAHLRAEAPLVKLEPEGFYPFWAVTKYDDIKEIEQNHEIFHNGGDYSAVILDKGTQEQIKAVSGGRPTMVHHITEMDGQEHYDYRLLTQKHFMPVMLRQLNDRVAEMSTEAIEDMANMGGECNFTKDIAFLYPLRVIMELLGVPREDEPLMLTLTQEFLGSTDPELNGGVVDIPPEQQLELFNKAMAMFTEYFMKITEDRRANPRDDIASVIANGQIDGEPIGHLEAMSYYILIATAGHDTTSNSLSGGMWQLAESPDLLQLLKDDPSLIPGFVDESIRWVTPVRSFMRNAVEDYEIRGQTIKKGDLLMLCYPSANRDETVFENPFKFDVTRHENKHLAFGTGPHLCLGKHLAKMEMQRFWEQLLPRLQKVEISGLANNVEANFVSGPKNLNIRYEMS